jgi:hypothetical protein
MPTTRKRPPAADFARDKLVAIVRKCCQRLHGDPAPQPQYVIEFPDGDPDRAICASYMHAQHHLDKLGTNEFRLLRGAYTNHMVRTAGGGRIARLIQDIRWHRAREQ